MTADRRPVNPMADQAYTEVGVRSFGRGLFHKPVVTGAELGTKRVFSIMPDRLIFNIVFAWEGAVARTTAHEKGTVASHRFPIFECTADLADLDFMNFLFRSEFGLELMRRSSPGSAGRNRTLSITELLEAKVPVPPLPEQRRIASWLSAVETRSRIVWEAHQRSGLVSSVLTERTVQIASSSEHVRLGTLMEVARTSIAIDERAIYKPIGVRSFGRGLIRYPSSPGSELSKLRYSMFPVPSLMVSNIKAWEGAIALTRTGDERRVASNRFIPLVPREGCSVDLDFIKAYLLSARGLEQIGAASPGSADRNRTTSVEGLLDIHIPDLGTEHQAQVGNVVRKLDSMRGSRINFAEKLEALLPSALNRVFGSLN